MNEKIIFFNIFFLFIVLSMFQNSFKLLCSFDKLVYASSYSMEKPFYSPFYYVGERNNCQELARDVYFFL